MDLEKLTAVLRENGDLNDVVVEDIHLTSIETSGIASEFFRTKLQFTSDDHSLPNP